MTTVPPKDEAGLGSHGVAQGNDHVQLEHLDKSITNDAPNKDTTFQPPEIIRAMTAEERAAAEKRLVRKIDFRLLPMMVLMYILNYIDRCVNVATWHCAGYDGDVLTIRQK